MLQKLYELKIKFLELLANTDKVLKNNIEDLILVKKVDAEQTGKNIGMIVYFIVLEYQTILIKKL